MYTADRTWPQLVCCALIAPNVLISGGDFRWRVPGRPEWPEWNRIGGVGNKIDFQTGELLSYRIELYILSEMVRHIIVYNRKVI